MSVRSEKWRCHRQNQFVAQYRQKLARLTGENGMGQADFGALYTWTNSTFGNRAGDHLLWAAQYSASGEVVKLSPSVTIDDLILPLTVTKGGENCELIGKMAS